MRLECSDAHILAIPARSSLAQDSLESTSPWEEKPWPPAFQKRPVIFEMSRPERLVPDQDGVHKLGLLLGCVA